MKGYFEKYDWILPVGLVGLSFVFFQFFYPYHLFFKEQIQLFLYTPNYFLSYFKKPAWLAAYFGDFLTQFFYLRGGGAAILASLFCFEWVLTAAVLKRITSSTKAGLWSLLPPSADWVLHCNTLHGVSVSVGFILVLCMFLIYAALSEVWISYAILTIFSLTGYWLLGSSFLIFPFLILAYDINNHRVHWMKWIFVLSVAFAIPLILRQHYLLTPVQAVIFPAFSKQSLLLQVALLFSVISSFFLKKIEAAHSQLISFGIVTVLAFVLSVGILNKADFNLEKILSLDGETYFGNPDRVIELSKKFDLKNKQATYFTNIALAEKGVLPEYLLDFYQPFSPGLIPQVTPEENWQSIFVSNEVFFLIGDMNMAQHSAMLGNTFSPYQRSSRMMRRLAEINLVTGDSAAAIKYLRILSKTLFHRKWAESQVRTIQSAETNKWLAGKRSQVSDADLLRKSNDYLSSLQFLVEQHPDNLVAVDYLLCYLLLNKEVKLFRENYERYYLKLKRQVSKVYAEALLVQLVADKASQQEAQSYLINPEIVTRFTEYTRIFEKTSGDMNALNKQFSKSYWFYYHFATIQKK
ncbi:hypothetical protein AQPE_2806 [Aquipluma nitroreducens]|uniref:Transmembrane protein n=1 Tax=Aquipluma nitroreducens TaxID=2010828 RepID=A0A5K7SAN2_9BACT|nr:DUF6057 family protein [Aquipluma nitroreducens]BBE18643.1 hypothetical protein AQPE_2806 [Aquipluma nitroreducens]